jgi:hypothetical protein
MVQRDVPHSNSDTTVAGDNTMSSDEINIEEYKLWSTELWNVLQPPSVTLGLAWMHVVGLSLQASRAKLSHAWIYDSLSIQLAIATVTLFVLRTEFRLGESWGKWHVPWQHAYQPWIVKKFEQKPKGRHYYKHSPAQGHRLRRLNPFWIPTNNFISFAFPFQHHFLQLGFPIKFIYTFLY